MVGECPILIRQGTGFLCFVPKTVSIPRQLTLTVLSSYVRMHRRSVSDRLPHSYSRPLELILSRGTRLSIIAPIHAYLFPVSNKPPFPPFFPLPKHRSSPLLPNLHRPIRHRNVRPSKRQTEGPHRTASETHLGLYGKYHSAIRVARCQYAFGECCLFHQFRTKEKKNVDIF